MKINKNKLKQLIVEEINNTLQEDGELEEGFLDMFKKQQPTDLKKRADKIQVALKVMNEILYDIGKRHGEKEKDISETLVKAIKQLNIYLKRITPQGTTALEEKIGKENEEK